LAKRKRYEDVMLLASGEEVPGHHTRYVIEHMVGLGAYGAVYAARDPETPGRQIALKEFFPARTPRDQAPLQALFDRERTVGMQASSHPLMPTFYEAFQSDSHFYIAQEFIIGKTLDDIIARRHPLARDWVLKWSVSLCDALAFLHSRQIVHHDLKPANIRITPQGHLCLLDFGAAQYFGAGHEDDAPSELYGTEGYLPPELEADGQWIADVRTDIFALGCVLYEMIAGVAPDQAQINERSMYVTNSLIQQPNADLGLVKLINKAISYNTEYRYATAGDFLEEMRQVAPPVLLVTKKNLRFGEIVGSQPAPALTVTLYNAGGGEIKGNIIPRAAWIVVPALRFTGNLHEIPVGVDASKAMERGKLLAGKLEISSDDQADQEGNIVAGDRWSVECSVMVMPAPGLLQAGGWEGAPAASLPVSGRRGQTATGQFSIKNVGETAAGFQILPTIEVVPGGGGKPMEGLQATPSEGTLAPKQEVSVAVSVPTVGLPPGAYQTGVIIRSPTLQTLAIPITLHVLSPLGYLKTRLGGR
jgi:hypothetical protein